MSKIKFTAEFEGKIYDLGAVKVPNGVLRDTLVASGLAQGVEKDTRRHWTGVGSSGVPIG